MNSPAGLLLTVLLGLLASPALSQVPVPSIPDNNPTPMSPLGAFANAPADGAVENVSLSNGSLNVQIPLLSLPQRGGYSLQLAYIHRSNNNESLTQQANDSVTPYHQDSSHTLLIDHVSYFDTLWGNNAALDINLPRLQSNFEYRGHWEYPIGSSTPTEYGALFCEANFIFTDWQGNSHPFENITNCNTAYSGITPVNVSDASDSSLYRIDTTNMADIKVVAKNGTTYHFTRPWPSHCTTTPGSCANSAWSVAYDGRANSIVDTNGNTMSIATTSDSSGNLSYQLTDTVGHGVSITPSGVGYTDSNGVARQIAISSTTAAMSTATPHSLSCGYTGTFQTSPYVNPTVGVAPGTNPSPTSTTTTISYPAANGGGAKTFVINFDDIGRLTKIQYPTGGYTQYAYGSFSMSQSMGNVGCSYYATPVVLKSECRNSQGSCSSTDDTQYVPTVGYDQQSNPYLATNKVIRPSQDYEIHKFGVASTSVRTKVAETDILSYNSSGTLLKTVHKDYTGNSTSQDGNYFYDFIEPTVVTTTLNDVSPAKSSAVHYTYPTYTALPFSQVVSIDNPTYIGEGDYDGSIKKATNTTWLPAGTFSSNAHILDRPSMVTVTDNVSNYQKSTAYVYDGGSNTVGNVTKTTVTATGAPTAVTTYTRNSYGQVTGVLDPNNHSTTISYDDSNAWADSSCVTGSMVSAYPSSVTNALSQTVSYKYNSCTGTIASVTGPNTGQTTSYTYDPLQRVITQTLPDSGKTEVCYFDTAPTQLKMFRLQAVGSSLPQCSATTATGNISTAVLFDGLGRTSQTQLLSDPAGTVYADTTYDSDGRVASTSTPYRSQSDSTYGVTTFGYDIFDRKTSTTLPGSNPQTAPYTGNTQLLTDEAGNEWQKTFNAFGQVTSVKEPNGTSAAPAITTSYVYNGIGDLTSVTQSGQSGETSRVRTFTYDGLSHLLTSTNPETGKICYGTVSGSTCSNGYDSVGNLLHKTDARGVATTYAYDALNRLTSQAFSDGTTGQSYGYDDTSGGSYGIGQMFGSFVGSVAGKGYYYDAMGRITGTSYNPPSANGNWLPGLSIKYDLAGNLTDITYLDGRHVKQTFDSAGRLATSGLVDISGVAQTQSYVQSVSYNPDGTPKVLTLGNGVQQTITENTRLQIQSMSSTSLLAPFNGQNFLANTYCYTGCTTGGTANNGNIWGITDTLKAANTQGFTYDTLNRIKSFSLGGTVSQQYTIDSFGNMSGLTGGVASTTFDSATNRINNLPCASSTTAYDASGNQLCDTDPVNGVRQYQYDALSRISQIKSLNAGTPFETYVYYADGDRARKTNANGSWTEYVQFNGQTYATQDQSGAWTDYIFAGGKKVARITGAPVLHAYGVCGLCTNGASNFKTPAIASGITAYVIRSQDKLIFQQKQTNSQSGLYVYASDGTNSLGHLYDSTGNGIAASTISDGTWHTRVVDLSVWAGKQLSTNIGLSDNANTTSSVQWDVQIANISLVSADGTVQTLFNGQGVAGTPWNASSGATFVESTSTDAAVTAHYYLGDHLGSAQFDLASGGYPVWRGQFSPFGTELDGQISPDPHRFTGKERDGESGLDYFGARYFESNMGRFMSPDWANTAEPIPYAKLDNPQSFNLYAYVGNNPIRGIDLDGHQILGKENSIGLCPANAAGNGCSKDKDDQYQQFAPNSAQQQSASSTSTSTINGRAQTQYNNDVPIIAKQLGVSKDEVLDSTHIAYDDKGNAIVIGGHVNMTVDSGSDAQQALAARLGPGRHGYNEDPNTGEGRGSEFSRLGGTPSVHLDHSLLHVDRFNAGAWGGLGVVPHYFYDVLYGGSKGNVALLPY